MKIRSQSTVPNGTSIKDRCVNIPMGETPEGKDWKLVITDHQANEGRGECLFIKTNNNVPTPEQIAQTMALEWKTLTMDDIVKRFTENPLYISEPHFLWEVLMYMMRSTNAAPIELIDGQLLDKIVEAHPILNQLDWVKHDKKMINVYIENERVKTPDRSIEDIKKGYVKWMRNKPSELWVMRGEVNCRTADLGDEGYEPGEEIPGTGIIVNIERAETRRKGHATKYHLAVRGSTLTEETEPFIHQWLRLDKVFAVDANIRRRGTLDNSRGLHPEATQNYLRKPRYMKRGYHDGIRRTEMPKTPPTAADELFDGLQALKDGTADNIRIGSNR